MMDIAVYKDAMKGVYFGQFFCITYLSLEYLG